MKTALTLLTLALLVSPADAGDKYDKLIAESLKNAGDNRPQLEQALKSVPKNQREGMRFLIAYMPQRDLKSLKAEFLLNNVRLAYQSWRQSRWAKQVPKEIFLNNVLPYASVTERRDDWRADFHKRFSPMVKDARTPSEAAAALNRKIFPLLKVRYSRKRNRADQGPYESIETGTASCTGLSVLLIDACRAVGVPARFVGTPLWSDGSGNHSWVEIYDNGWHFTGAAEPTGNALDRGWFITRASKAKKSKRLNAIYAVSYRKTPITFPMVWNRKTKVYAVNVTSRYTRRKKKLPAGIVEIHLRAFAGKGTDRVPAKTRVVDANGKTVFAGKLNDEGFDANDHIVVAVQQFGTFTINAEHDGKRATVKVSKPQAGQLVTLRLR